MKYRKRILSSLLLSVLLLSTIPVQAVEREEGMPASEPSASIGIANTEEVSSSATDTSLTAPSSSSAVSADSTLSSSSSEVLGSSATEPSFSYKEREFLL